MKTKLIFILLAGNLLGLCPAMAQAPLASEEVHYANEVGGEVIVRNQNDIVLVICSKAVDGSNDHTFMVRSLATGVTQGFTCNLGTMFSQPTDNYIIKDMRIFDRKCYFCGMRERRISEPLYDVYGNILESGLRYEGFIGSFYTSSINAGGSLEMFAIPETDSLTRMVVHGDNPSAYRTFLMAIGSLSDNSHSPCIVELMEELYSGRWVWTERIVRPIASDISESFTDIILTEGLLEVASKLNPDDNNPENRSHYIFRLHETKRDGFYFMSVVPHTTTNVLQYNTRTYGYAKCYRQSDEPVRLSPLNYDNFCVAFASDYYSNRQGGPVAFKMNSAETMIHAQYQDNDVQCHIKDIVSSSPNQETALLCYSNTQTNGIIRLSRWPNVSGYSTIEWMGKKILSLDNIFGQSIVAGCTFSNNQIGLMQQDINALHNTISCFNIEFNSFESLSPIKPETEQCQWECVLNKGFIEAAQPFQPRSMVAQTICEIENTNQ